jgi:hypothetical protein
MKDLNLSITYPLMVSQLMMAQTPSQQDYVINLICGVAHYLRAERVHVPYTRSYQALADRLAEHGILCQVIQ